MMILYLLPAPFALLAAYRCHRLFANYRAARVLQLPIIVLPTSFEDPLWMLVRPLFSWVEELPFGLGSWYRYTDVGWPMVDGRDTVSRIGESFVLVSPLRNQIITAYPPAADRIYKDRSFILPSPFADVFIFYGQNVSSTNGADWQRHRKITAPAFNERSNRYVWEQSLRRTAEMLEPLSDTTTWTLAVIREKLGVLAMHVLVAVAFGQDTELTTVSNGHKMTLMDSLGFILKHIFIVSIIFSGLNLPDFLLPSILRKLKLSVKEFRLYMEESVLKQMQSPSTKSTQGTGSMSLLEAIVSANEAEKQELRDSAPRSSFLTDSELYGNLFVFNLAGYETTAGSMSFALPYLAAHPKVQDWLVEEIDSVYTHYSNNTYEETYPKLVRCLAFMYEVLRLAGPAPQMIRAPTVPTLIQISPSTSVTIEPGTLVSADFYGLHLSPQWGADVHDFNPRRWISKSADGHETLASPPEGAMYIAWLFGLRVCPGKRFSQVEFTAVIAHMLSQYRIELAMQNNESNEAARKRLLAVLDEKFFNVSAHLKRPDDASIRLLRRDAVKSR